LFLIANPNGHTVGLEYEPPEMPVPVVFSRSSTSRARIAMAHVCCVPVITNEKLAEDLYASTAVGKRVPTRFYADIADIVATLMRSSSSPRGDDAA
jgi:flagellar biosynthesis protein FlhB